MRLGRRGRLLRLTMSVTSALAIVGGGHASGEDPPFLAMQVAHIGGEVEAPPFELATPEGRSLSLADLKGKVIFLNFWATWCPPCREEMPSMERLHQAFKDQGLAVLAVNIQESPKQVARFMKDFQLSFPALLDADLKVAQLYQVRGLPSTFLIDRNGRLIGRAVGARDWASPPAQALVRSVFSAPAARR